MIFEPSDRENALRDTVEQIEQRAAPFRVAHRGDYFRRLVQEQVHQRLPRLQELARDLDVVAGLIGFRAELRHSCAVHGHQSGSDHFLRVSARGNSRARNNFLQSLFHGILLGELTV